MAYIPLRQRRGGFNLKRFLAKLTPQKVALYGTLALIALVVIGYLFTFLVFAWYSRQLPSPGKLSQNQGASTVFYDRDGKTLYEMYKDKNRVPVPFDQISKYLKNATVAIEDKRFYTHHGISEFGILRAAVFSILGQSQGGSTITQQLIKNVLLTSERSVSRKIKEAILAGEVEKRYSKEQILEMYLNENPYGGSYWGVGSASKGYFDKTPKDLTLVESAFLAGLPQSPSRYSPFLGKTDAWKGRTKDVLRRMREDGYIVSDQEKQALAQLEKMKFTSPKLAIEAPHFVFYAKRQIEDEIGAGLLDRGVKVKTTIAYDVQDFVQKAVKTEIEKIKKDYHVGNGAVVVLDSQTGEILAMVGSYDFNDEDYGKFNVAVDGLRQPGSALKPIEYATAFEKGYTPSTVIMDVKTNFGKQGDDEYTPENYDGKFRGPVEIRFALGNSFNLPAVKMLAMVGLRDFLQKAYDMGLSTLAPTQDNMNNLGLSASLGGGETTLLELTSAYSVLARGGIKIDTQPIIEISDFQNKGIYKKPKVQERKVLSPEVSFLISHILSDNNARSEEFGLNSYLNIPGKTVAVKTGTTNDKRDNWAIGFTKSVTVGVWVGNNDNSPMNAKIASGTTGASEIWYTVMREILKKYPDGIIDKPDKVKAMEIDAYLGGLPKDGYPKRSEYFIEGAEPKDIAPYYKKLKISKANGKLANDIEIRTGNYEEKDFICFTETDPISTDGKNRWQEAIDAWAREQSDEKYHCATETSDASADSVVVSIKSPNDKSKVDSNNVEIKAKITSLSSIKNIKIYANGSEVKSLDGDRKDIDETVTLLDGVYDLKVKVWNDKDQLGEATIKVGVKMDWDSISPTPPPSPTSS
ncbi:hypothetical protein A2966_03750 [Candidatus Roizmanbacteria bacterium RIFCSPLOWO2_01_FULL_41_22]|uniref:Uncharacterized protein n=2 Tax=Candidatus Roizmaniibacteriota TaxID=1752723 RepID=A0A1F7JQP9_9BACT|nr:MAG: hypothetical protein A2966_03750 [Candidatus Roizmanbacteria bacterium RIFCSPLOWO2_01_FULL_41_22]OGK57925.1 MAG: hypothetical protein A3H86_01790 [Candidatus Roizmanbacteria bacterium RIFCSPLOWO2_02_FULL_41_9]